MPYASYYTVHGDGDLLYTMRSYADKGVKYNAPFLVSPESDGLTWTQHNGGAQKFDNGPCILRFDKVNRILYSANWNAGVWALKIPNASGVRREAGAKGGRKEARRVAMQGGRLFVDRGNAGRMATAFDLHGNRLGRARVEGDGWIRRMGTENALRMVLVRLE